MNLSINSQYSGQLYKYTNVVKGWQYRYFLVDSKTGYLHYYYLADHSGKLEPDGNPRASVYLGSSTICPSEEDSKTFIVNCSNGTFLKLRASDARERQEWVNNLRAVSEAHTKTTGSISKLAPNERLDALYAFSDARNEISKSEQENAELCRLIENSTYHLDPDLLLLKSISNSTLHCLTQCLSLFQQIQYGGVNAKFKKSKSKDSIM